MDWGFPVGVIASVSSPGLFAFCVREKLEPPPFEVDAKLFAPSFAEELTLEHLKCPIRALRSKDRQTDGPGYEIGELQSGGVGLLVGEFNGEWQLAPPPVSAVTNSPEFQLQITIFFFTSALNDDVSRTIALFFLLNKLKQRLETESESQMVWIAFKLSTLPEPRLADDAADQNKVARVDQPSELVKKNFLFQAIVEAEDSLFLPYVVFVMTHHFLHRSGR